MLERDLDSRSSEIHISGDIEGLNLVANLTVREVAKKMGKPWTWVVRHIAPLKDKLELPQGDFNVLEVKVPRDVFIQIDFIDETDKSAEDWITTTALAERLGVEFKWVNRRLLGLRAKGEFRIGTSGSYLYLPPEALDELKILRDQALTFFEAGAYLNIRQLAKACGRNRLWVSNRLDQISFTPVLALDARGKAVECYPKAVLELLLKQKDEYSEADNMFTIPQLSKIVGKDREWIEAQLADMGAVGEYRHFSKSGRVDLCFTQELLHKLIKRVKPYKDPKPDWHTMDALIALTGKSRNWVSNRLLQLGAKPRLFSDVNGALRKHYSPSIGKKLEKMAKGWSVSRVLKYEENKTIEDLDEAGRFRDIFKKAGVAMTIKGFQALGVTEQELQNWMEMGLVTKWKSGQYHFTKLGEAVVSRVAEADEVVNRSVGKLESVMKDSY